MRLRYTFPLVLTAALSFLQAAPVPKAEEKVDEKTCKVIVERVGDFSVGIDIRRIQIWTLDKRKVHLHLNGGNQTFAGETEPDPKDGKLHRVEILIISSFSPSDERIKGVQQLDLDRWIRIGGKRATSSHIVDTVPPTIELEKVVDLPALSSFNKLGEKVRLGKLHGDRVEVEVVK